jgi:autotransporter-associated beta strand protein
MRAFSHERRARVKRSLATVVAAATAALTMTNSATWADSGTWTNTAGGNWNLAETGNWLGGIVADGADNTADFSTLNITGDRTVTLTEARTIGHLIFADAGTNSHGWTLSSTAPADALTLAATAGTPTITVNGLGAPVNNAGAAKAVTINSIVAGNNGLAKAGNGLLVLTAANTYTGGTSVNAGTLHVAQLAALPGYNSLGQVVVNSGGTLSVAFGNAGPWTNADVNTLLANATFNSGSSLGLAFGSAEGTITYSTNLTNIGLTKRGNGGTLVYNGTFNGGAINVDRAFVGSAPVVFNLDGGSITADALSTIQGAGSGQSAASFILTSGTAAFNGGIRTDNGDTGQTIRINGGAFTASDVTVQRNSAGSASFSSGFIVAGGTATVGTVNIGTGNSNAAMSVEGGSLTATGAVTLGSQQTGGRGGHLRVTAGSFAAAELVMSRVNANNNNANNVATATFSGGISTIDQLTLGFDSAVTAGSATVNLNGGTLYLGSGGVVKNGAFTTTINLSSGLLGAKADWAATHNFNLNGVAGTPVTIKAADAADAPHNIVINGNLSGAGSLSKTGGGSLTLNGNSTYAGTTTVLAGSLIGNTSSIPGSVVNDGVVTFDQPTNGTYAGIVSGTGSFTKSGAAALVLSSAQTYTGATLVSGGTLRIGGVQGTSGILVANGAALAMSNGGASINALVLGAGAGDAITLSVNSGSGIAPLNVTGNNGLTANGTTTIDLGIAGYTVGEHVLVDYAGAIGGGGFGAFTLGALPPRVTASLVHDTLNTSIDLNVTAIDFPQWVGNLSGDWDINTTANWKEATSGATTTYLQSSVPGDQVLFTDDATGTTTINIAQTVQPSFVTVNNDTKPYTFTGAGISGPTGINKQGPGTLTVSNSGNNYTGATNIFGGSVILGGHDRLSDNSAINVNGGTLDVATFSDTTGPVTLTSGAIAGAPGGMLSAPSFDLRAGTVTASLSGAGTLDKNSGGTVALNTQASYAGSTNVNEGTLQLGGSDVIPIFTTLTIGAAAASGVVELNSFNQSVERLLSSGTGTANSIRNSVTGGGPATLTITGANEGNANSTYSGALDGNLALRWNSTGVLTLTGTSTFTGGTTVDNGGTLAIGGDAALGAVPATATNNVVFNNVAATLRAAATDVNLAATRDILIDAVTLNIDSNGGDNTMTINGVINGSGHVGKAGNGTVILNAANTYGGNTTILAGNLRAGHNSAFSGSSVRITASSGSMQLADGVTLANNLISQSNSDNMVDVPQAGANATFAGNVTVESGGGGTQYRVAANGAGATLTLTGTATLPNTFVANAGNIIMSGSASINASGNPANNNALLGRPNTSSTVLAFTLKDNTSASFEGFTNLGNARNMTDLSLTIQDNATYATAGPFNLLDTTAATAASAVNLNGGSLTSGAFTKTSTGAGRTATINFNGGVLRAAAASTAYIPAAAGLSGKVKDGGAIIDTNGFDVTVAAPLEADGTGGLTKNGLGALVLSGAATYTGPTAVNVGKLQLETSLTTSASVSVADDATLEVAPLQTRVVKTGNVTIAQNARLDLKDNKLITTTPVGTFTAGAYNGVHGEVQRAYHSGAWDRPGLMTSMPDAGPTIGTTTIGVATASTILFIAPTATGTWAGQQVTGTTTLAMYTYAGDLNFDGRVDAQDYGVIDNWVQFPGTNGYANGDINYDGVIDAADYGIIDNTIQLQGPPIPTGGAGVALAGSGGEAGLSGVTAVPEPASLAAIGLGGAALLGRRRRHRPQR